MKSTEVSMANESGRASSAKLNQALELLGEAIKLQ